MNRECPACDAPLRSTATTCVCGWVMPEIANPQIGIQQTLRERDEREKRRLNDEAHRWCVERGMARMDGETLGDWLRRTGVLKKISVML